MFFIIITAPKFRVDFVPNFLQDVKCNFGPPNARKIINLCATNPGEVTWVRFGFVTCGNGTPGQLGHGVFLPITSYRKEIHTLSWSHR